MQMIGGLVFRVAAAGFFRLASVHDIPAAMAAIQIRGWDAQGRRNLFLHTGSLSYLLSRGREHEQTCRTTRAASL